MISFREEESSKNIWQHCIGAQITRGRSHHLAIISRCRCLCQTDIIAGLSLLLVGEGHYCRLVLLHCTGLGGLGGLWHGCGPESCGPPQIIGSYCIIALEKACFRPLSLLIIGALQHLAIFFVKVKCEDNLPKKIAVGLCTELRRKVYGQPLIATASISSIIRLGYIKKERKKSNSLRESLSAFFWKVHDKLFLFIIQAKCTIRYTAKVSTLPLSK